jgi:hypothetical protein
MLNVERLHHEIGEDILALHSIDFPLLQGRTSNNKVLMVLLFFPDKLSHLVSCTKRHVEI